jgi:hypothetical protein
MIGPARLDGYRLVFNVHSRSWGGGAANAVPAIGGHLWGILWEIGEAEMKALDSFRGDEHMQQVFEVEVQAPEGPVRATTFAVDSPERFVAPTDRYVTMLGPSPNSRGCRRTRSRRSMLRAAGGRSGPTPSI